MQSKILNITNNNSQICLKIIFILILTQLFNCTTNPPNSSSDKLEFSKVFITSNVEGASIIIDGTTSGKFAPDTIVASVGEHIIRLEKENYLSSTQIVNFNIDSVSNVSFILQLTTVKKIVLLEDFSNVSCDPCVLSNKILHTLSSNIYKNEIVVVKYPTDFPSSNDPFYLANKGDSDSRIKYYNILAAPTVIIDGITRPLSTDSVSIKNAIQERLNSDSNFKISVEKKTNNGILDIKVIVETISIEGLNTNNLKLQIIVTETNIVFDNPPGSNGETEFYHVMRKMLPTNNGKELTATKQGITIFENQIIIDSGWDPNNLNVAAFIQNSISKEILQAATN